MSSQEHEKPSTRGQWHERSDRPIAARPMTHVEIEEHRVNLVRSYQCDDKDITFDFQKILDENDEDRDDCLWLKYRMKCVISSKPSVRDVFSIKLPIPEEVRQVAERLRQEQARKNGVKSKSVVHQTNASAHAQASAHPHVSGPTVEEVVDEPIIRPKLRKPIRVVRK